MPVYFLRPSVEGHRFPLVQSYNPNIMLITSISVDCTFRNSLLLSLDSFRRIFPGVSVSMNQTCLYLLKLTCWKKSSIFAAQHSTKGLDNSTNRARKMHCSGTKSARFGLERISSWARNWHDLGSKTAPVESRNRHVIRSKTAQFGLEVGTQTPKCRGSKISNFGTKSRDFTTSDG